MNKSEISQKLKKSVEIKTKKDVFFICVSIVLILLIIFCLIEKKQIVKEITVLRYEKQYKQTQDCADLINLVVILQDSKRDNAKIKYSKALLDTITEEGIYNSVLKSTSYKEAMEFATPYEIAIDLYLFSILSAKEYELYVTEFVDLYPKLSFQMRIIVEGIAPDNYSRTKDIKAIESTVIAYSKIAKNTDEEILVQSCLANIVTLRDVIKDYYGEKVSIDNEFLRSMTVDGEHIPITAKGKTIRYYCVSTGEYVEKI